MRVPRCVRLIDRLGLGTDEVRAWAMYDWANSASATTVMAAFLPIYFSRVAASDLPRHVATAYWGYTTAIALALIAVLSPVLGAIQSLNRSLFASMVPVGRATEFFGFYSVSSKFAGIAGPLMFAVAGLSMGTGRRGILSLVLFFLIGAVLLTRVDVVAGMARARQEEALMRVKNES